MTDKAISPLRRRLIEDMTVRRLGPKTQLHYIRHVKRFADFLGRSADKATAEDVHRYQLWLASIGTTVPTVNVSATTLRFFFKVTLKRRDLADAIVSVREPRRLPVVLSPGRGRSASRIDDEHQAQGGPEPDICHRPAVIEGRIAHAPMTGRRPKTLNDSGCS
jgi:Phage integrase, N-terminal SAM-like domain